MTSNLARYEKSQRNSNKEGATLGEKVRNLGFATLLLVSGGVVGAKISDNRQNYNLGNLLEQPAPKVHNDLSNGKINASKVVEASIANGVTSADQEAYKIAQRGDEAIVADIIDDQLGSSIHSGEVFVAPKHDVDLKALQSLSRQ